MAQFEVYVNQGKNRSTIPFVVDVQSSYYQQLNRRVVVPLVSQDVLESTTSLPISAINPMFIIANKKVILNPLEIVSIPINLLSEKVASLDDESDLIIAALDELFLRS